MIERKKVIFFCAVICLYCNVGCNSFRIWNAGVPCASAIQEPVKINLYCLSEQSEVPVNVYPSLLIRNENLIETISGTKVQLLQNELKDVELSRAAVSQIAMDMRFGIVGFDTHRMSVLCIFADRGRRLVSYNGKIYNYGRSFDVFLMKYFDSSMMIHRAVGGESN